MEWVANTLHTTSEHGVSSITTADAHTLNRLATTLSLYRLSYPGCVEFRQWQLIFVFSEDPDRLWSQPSLPICTGVLCRGSRISGAIPQLFLYAIVAWRGTNKLITMHVQRSIAARSFNHCCSEKQ